MNERRRHPRNAPGPFNVENGCCTSCMAPHTEAPELMGYDAEDHHCFFSRQPATDEELYQAIRAIRSSEFGCLRYAGSDPSILRRLAELGEAERCDQPAPPLVGWLLRNHVTFAFQPQQGESPTDHALTFAHDLRSHFLASSSRHTASPITSVGPTHDFTCSWSTEQLDLHITAIEPTTGKLLLWHSRDWLMGSQALSLIIDDWLSQNPAVQDLRWYTAADWSANIHNWQRRPI